MFTNRVVTLPHGGERAFCVINPSHLYPTLHEPANYEILVTAEGLEPPPRCLGNSRSIHLSYAVDGANGTSRTCDLPLTRRTLYHLSYEGFL